MDGKTEMDAKAQMYQRIQKISSDLHSVLRQIDPVSASDAPTSNGCTDAVTGLEDRLARRSRIMQEYIMSEMEQQAIAIGIMTLAVVVSAFYVFYKLVEHSFRVHRCRCAVTSPTDWANVVRAAQVILTPGPLGPASVGGQAGSSG